MKRVVIIAALGCLLMVSAAYAKDSTGCGLGTMLFDGQQGLVPQVVAVTTNGTSGNQTFGITSGTLGCDTQGTIQYNAAVQRYMGKRLDRVAADMSAGGGEHLRVLADLIGIEEGRQAEFFRMTQKNFVRIVPGDDVDAEQVLLNLQQVMAENEEWAGYVA
jgi:hypothetical protein